ncbi:glutamate receptor ionotropic, delta-1-like isoform X4 [Portunus trituberculatus]|uniref:glutamate receptor ionotropic, delta-1-like isoform X4 n=1 Tax=Portunus trituberculatus TaxID=210409 RepID=UPI001E1CC8D4|nr:glutamate receptor ionotropic, delta-1-like isoform X4 [Portunus trituberculatus]
MRAPQPGSTHGCAVYNGTRRSSTHCSACLHACRQPRPLLSHIYMRRDMSLAEALCFLACLAYTAQLNPAADRWNTDAVVAVKEVFQSSSQVDASLIIIAGKSFTVSLFIRLPIMANSEQLSLYISAERDKAQPFQGQIEDLLGDSRGAAVFETTSNTSRLGQVVASARQVRQASWEAVVIIVSDDPAFLVAFAVQARETRLFVWATKLIVVTRRWPHRLHPLHQMLSITNSLLVVLDAVAGVRRLSKETNLLVAMEQNHGNKVVMQPDPTAPSGTKLLFRGFMVPVLEYLAQGLNFSFSYQRPPDGAWGAKLPNGSFSGMVGQVHREDVNFGLGPFSIDAARNEVIEFTWPISFVVVKVFAGRGSPEVDPWAFLLPLGPGVWAAMIASILVLSIITFFLSTVFLQEEFNTEHFVTTKLKFISIVLRQSVWIEGNVWWWERLILGVWMLMTLVLMRSYESTLMSLLAVRHLPQPYQTLRAVLDDHSVGMVWHKQGAIMQAIMDATSGIFIEVKASEEEGRLTKLPLYAYASIVDQIISHAKVIIDYDVITTVVRNDHFSETGRCDFYFGHERILSHPISLISQKDSPLIPVFNKRITSMTEAGLYNYWEMEALPNSSACNRVPTKITVSSSLSLRQCWAMLVVLAVGLTAAVVTLCMEGVLAQVLHH